MQMYMSKSGASTTSPVTDKSLGANFELAMCDGGTNVIKVRATDPRDNISSHKTLASLMELGKDEVNQ